MNILGMIFGPVVELFKVDQKTKIIKLEGKHKIAQAKIDLKVAQLSAKAKSEETQTANAMTYDMQVLKNSSKSLMDEIASIFVLLLIILHFIPAMQPYMTGGWQAMDYKGVPWWFEFIVVGMFVRNLALMGVLRLFLGPLAKMRKDKD